MTMTPIFTVSDFSLVLLIGPSGSGKTTFAHKHFLATEVVSSDACRAMISDDENNQDCSRDAFDLLHQIVAKRLKRGKFTVVDATNVSSKLRLKLLHLASHFYAKTYAIIFNIPLEKCLELNSQRKGRVVPNHIIHKQYDMLQTTLQVLPYHEKITNYIVLSNHQDVDSLQISRKASSLYHFHERGPFDLIGDVHGCFDELILLLNQLGYEITENFQVHHPQNRKVIFVGDLVDRGPKSPEVLNLVMEMVASKSGFCVCGNHDDKLKRKLQGRDVKINHGLEETLDQLQPYSQDFKEKVMSFLENLPHHMIFDQGRLVVAHAGILEKYIGYDTSRVKAFCLFGQTTGEIDTFGLPVRYPWALEYQGHSIIIYGHTPVANAQWVNGTMNIDTGCVYGNKLTALRYPEKELVWVSALKAYYNPRKPFMSENIGCDE